MIARTKSLGRLGWTDAPFVLSLILVSFLPVSVPGANLDSSWQTGLGWAMSKGLPFGSKIEFTYGPLSFLDTSIVFDVKLFGLWVLATLFSGWLILFAVRAALRSRLSPLLSGLVILLLVVPAMAADSPFSTRVLLCAIVLVYLPLTRALSRPLTVGLLVAAAALSGLTLLDKFPNGLLAGALVCLSALIAPARWSGRVLAGALAAVVFAVTVPIIWIATGQSGADLVPWIRGSIELTSGYSDAMSVEEPVSILGYVALVVVALLIAAGIAVNRRIIARPLVLAFVTAVIVYVGMRLGLTRHDPAHEPHLFVILVVVAILAGAHFERYRMALLAASISVLVALSATSSPFLTTVDPGRASDGARQSITALVSAADRANLAGSAAAQLQTQYQLDADTLAALDGRTVHVDPFESNVAWAYDLDWDPVPVFQTYSSYTPYLDGLNARSLVASGGPESVLRGIPYAIDGRNPMWDSPDYMTTLVCDFRVANQSDRWLVLDRTVDRCGTPAAAGSIRVDAGDRVQVPTVGARSMVIARIDLAPDPLNEAATLLLKPIRPLRVTIDGHTYRLPRGEAADQLILRMPSNSGWASQFGADLDANSITLNSSGTIHFETITVK